MYKCSECGNEFLLPVKIIIPLSDPDGMLVSMAGRDYPTNHEEASKEHHVSRLEYRCPKCNTEVWEKRDKPFDNEYTERTWNCILTQEPCIYNGKCRSCAIGNRHKTLSSEKKVS